MTVFFSFSIPMVRAMTTLGNQRKVFNSVIVSNPVKVMDNFFRKLFQVSSQMFFHNKSVFSDISITDSKRVVWNINPLVSPGIVKILALSSCPLLSFVRFTKKFGLLNPFGVFTHTFYRTKSTPTGKGIEKESLITSFTSSFLKHTYHYNL